MQILVHISKYICYTYIIEREKGNEMSQMMNSFSRKQAGVIYSANKRGDITVDQGTISYMYDLTEGGVDFNGSKNSDIQSFCLAIDAIFDNDYEKAQKHINDVAMIEVKEEPEFEDDDFEDVIIEGERYEVISASDVFEIMEENEESVIEIVDRFSKKVTAIFTIENGTKKYEYVF